MTMRTSDEALAKIKEFEGCRLTAYKCPAGVMTIGHGHTKGVREGMRISEAQAATLLRGDLLPCEKYINGLGLELTQGQFDALVDFAFNLGTGRLMQSTLLRKIIQKAPDARIQNEFKRWVYGGSKVLPGLVKRRAWEADMWARDK